MRSRYILFIALILAMAGFSCRQKGAVNITQGEIYYNIEYVGDFAVPKDFLPKNLIVSFKDDKILFEMTGMVNSGIVLLTNPEKEIFDTYFSLPPFRYYYAGKPGEVYPGFEAMDGMIITKTSKTATICGLNCNNAVVTFPNDRHKKVDIWYTDEIKMKNPNISSPFHQIEGVLMSFFFLMGSTELHFYAESVFGKEIPDATFKRKDKFDRVSRENIEKLINKMGSD